MSTISIFLFICSSEKSKRGNLCGLHWTLIEKVSFRSLFRIGLLPNEFTCCFYLNRVFLLHVFWETRETFWVSSSPPWTRCHLLLCHGYTQISHFNTVAHLINNQQQPVCHWLCGFNCWAALCQPAVNHFIQMTRVWSRAAIVRALSLQKHEELSRRKFKAIDEHPPVAKLLERAHLWGPGLCHPQPVFQKQRNAVISGEEAERRGWCSG